MTAWLADTSVWVRYANAADALHAVCVDAIAVLHRRGDVVRTTPQVLIEFRSVATRPANVNGLGLTSAAAATIATRLEQQFPLLDDTAAVYPAWKGVVDSLGVLGKQVHDARLVAVCAAHGSGAS